MKPSAPEYAQALYNLLEETPEQQVRSVVKNFAETIKQHQQLDQSNNIISEFSDLARKKNSSIHLAIISSRPLNNLTSLAEKISSQLEKDIEIKNLVNPEIISGLIIRYQDFKLDFSLRSHLNKVNRISDQVDLKKLPKELLLILEIVNQQHETFFSTEQKKNKDSKIEIVELKTANPLKNISQLEKRLSAKLHHKIIIHFHQDSKLISGAIINYGNQKIDDSLQGKINSKQ